MRRILVFLGVGVCALPLFGVVRHRPVRTPPPAPTALPSPAPTATPSAPVIVIYPLTVNGDTEKDAGTKIAALFANSILQSGGIVIKPTSPGVARQEFLNEAKRLGADYYISGFLTPLGNEVALVEQVVSTFSGTVVYANTAQVSTYADASAQGQVLRNAVLTHAGRVVAEYNRPVAEPSTTPTPSSGKEANIGGLFRHRTKGTQGVSVAVRRSGSVTVVRVDGSAPDAARGAASKALLGSFQRLGDARLSAIVTENIARDAPSICGAERQTTVASGSLAMERGSFGRSAHATFTLRIYGCDGKLIYQETERNTSIDRAVNAAVDKYVATHPA
ncbi:MAG: hypothetical protein M3160_10590 [Candidatus Eremiobacteraeota bacterium]|nr:hypothetical protein [Candidatus Eremiobacteraeota bacterium]